MPDGDRPDLTTLTVQLLSAYVTNNAVPANGLADLIRTTRAALAEGDDNVAVEVESQPDQEPEYVAAVPVRTSLASRDHILSMIDGKPYKTLKRHLSTHGLTPEEYRIRYKLPHDYPMVAPSYSEQRRKVAKELGLGRKGQTARAAADAAPVESVASEPIAPIPAPRKKRTPAKRASEGAKGSRSTTRKARGSTTPEAS
ncbi:MucR family transcriptional regulator [Aquamicrobium sp. NLF2-7]|uniref:MucR family transcriptional regulator n=1 Tax=Aquamicrobium sp. NLF2-7 TaxID=2918753 RepID=UPI001EFB103A|nr:MucR family transcriptional regulator [Aquamicrobium sp. NLF2-7]MCG8273891.1 MucR family transcriptional regulator [Aquamicrobium sp. NLF2-7]